MANITKRTQNFWTFMSDSVILEGVLDMSIPTHFWNYASENPECTIILWGRKFKQLLYHMFDFSYILKQHFYA